MELRSGAFVALLGAFAGAGALLLMSQATPTSAPLRVQYVPSPRDFVQIQQGQPYTVPSGRIFVPTAVGLNQWNGAGTINVGLFINGVPQVMTSVLVASEESSMVAVPAGLSAGPGSVVEPNAIAGSGLTVRCWGYLYQI